MSVDAAALFFDILTVTLVLAAVLAGIIAYRRRRPRCGDE